VQVFKVPLGSSGELVSRFCLGALDLRLDPAQRARLTDAAA